MKNIRRSLNKERASAHSKQASVSAVPPKLVIKAVAAYAAQSPRELSFKAGDFFHVMSAEGGDDFFDASNPLENARGFVPVSHFQVLGRNVRESSNAATKAALFGGGGGGGGGSSPKSAGGKKHSSGGGKPLYGIVQYDFVAERADELDAKRGEPIIVIAQSNHEWFVAKPIGRLGGPGLIPVSFVEIQDMATGKPVQNVADLMKSSVVPKVEEWKKMTAEYKNASIPLGRFDFPASGGDSALADGRFEVDAAAAPAPTLYANEHKQFGIVTAASVESFHQEEGSFWFHLKVFFSTGASLILYRLYHDFYEFQIALMEDFPVEAGRAPPRGETELRRILPMMPGPTDVEDEVVCSQRVHDLSIYLGELCELPEYVRIAPLMYEFFMPRAGDVEIEAGNMQGDVLHAELIAKLSGASGPTGPPQNTSDRLNSIEGQYDELVRYLAADEGNEPNRNGSEWDSSGAQDRSATQDSSIDSLSRGIDQLGVNDSRDTRDTPANDLSPANDAHGALAPGFIKIKVFDTKSDDLIAIRVPPYVTLQALLDKVRDRLGGNINELCYKLTEDNAGSVSSGPAASASGATLIPLAADSMLQDYIRSTSRYVLYAM